jgi:hypothetical protein
LITTGKATNPRSALRTLLGFDTELDNQLVKIINKTSNNAKWRNNSPGNSKATKVNAENRIVCATILVDVFGEIIPEHWLFNQK